MTKHFDLETFTFNGHTLRTVKIDGEPWFVATDVRKAILPRSTTGNMTQPLDASEKGVQTLHTLGGPQRLSIIADQVTFTPIHTIRGGRGRLPEHPSSRGPRKGYRTSLPLSSRGAAEIVPLWGIHFTFNDMADSDSMSLRTTHH